MFNRLSEKDKHWYAGGEALKFSYGGISYIAQLFFCSRNTIQRGIIELDEKVQVVFCCWVQHPLSCCTSPVKPWRVEFLILN